jgi:hypothetical protein
VEGSVKPLLGCGSSHLWVRDLNIMRVSKIGVWSSESGGKDDLSKLLGYCQEDPPFRNAIVTYLGFKFRPIGLFFRDMDTKDFRTYVTVKKFKFYVCQKFDERFTEFRYGDPIVLLEGPPDAEAFSYLTGYPWVIAYLRSWIGPYLAAFLASLTNRVLVVPDNDAAGYSGFPKIKKNLNAFGVQVDQMITTGKDFRDTFDEGFILDVNTALMHLSCNTRNWRSDVH